MIKNIIELIKKHMEIFPQSVDSQLWNDRVEILIEEVKKLQDKNEP